MIIKTSLVIGFMLSSTMAVASQKVCFGIADRKGERLTLDIAEQNLSIAPQTELGNASAGVFKSTGRVIHSQSGINYLQYDGGTFGECGTLYYLADEALLSVGGEGKLKVVCRSNTEAYFCRDSH